MDKQAIAQAAVAALTEETNRLLWGMAICGIIVVVAAVLWVRSIR